MDAQDSSETTALLGRRGSSLTQAESENLQRRITNNSRYQAANVSIEDGSWEIDARLMTKDKITLTWDNINAFVASGTTLRQRCASCCRRGSDAPTAKQILRNVTGMAQPGQLLAILGASGAGKTTLLNVLNQRNISSLTIDGTLCVNGRRVNPRAMAAVSAYIQQDDLFIGTLTPAEHLWFQAMLRMDRHITDDVRKQLVADVIKEVGLTSCANTLIGTPPRIRGISGGERKRLAFASEVLTNPSLLFCDEPTSGLDSFMAENVITVLKKLAARGKTIVCTIHQPSSQVYAMFDRVLIMAEGRVAYLGPTAELHEFFAKLDSFCPANFNPADFYIHKVAIVPGREVECRQFVKEVCDTFERSDEFAEVRNVVSAKQRDYQQDDVMMSDLQRRSPYKSSIWRQSWVVLWRCWQTVKRDPIMLRGRFIQTLFISVLLGLIYLRLTYDQKGIMNINGALFLLLTQMTFGSLFSVINTFPLEYPIFMREHHNGMYRTGVYFLSKTLAELPVFIMMPLVFSSITYWMIGLYSDVEVFLTATCVLLLVTNIAVSFGYMVSCSTSNVTLAIGIAPLVLIPLMLFGGFYLNAGSIPVWLIWLKYISWFSYSNEIMVVNQWKYVKNITCELLTDTVPDLSSLMTNTSTVFPPHPSAPGRCFPDGKAVIQSLSFDENNVFVDFMVLLALLIGFRIIAFILLFIRSRKRE